MYLTILGGSVSAQSHRDFAARYSLKSSQDTVSAYLKNNLGFGSKVYSPHLWADGVTFIDAAGNKMNFTEDQLDYMELTDHTGRLRKFVPPTALAMPKLNLLEVNYEGKLGMYTDYYMDKSRREFVVQQFLAEEGQKPILVASHGRLNDPVPGTKKPSQLNVGFYNSFRKKLKERFAEYPDLQKRINEMKSYEDLIGIIADYNQR